MSEQTVEKTTPKQPSKKQLQADLARLKKRLESKKEELARLLDVADDLALVATRAVEAMPDAPTPPAKAKKAPAQANGAAS